MSEFPGEESALPNFSELLGLPESFGEPQSADADFFVKEGEGFIRQFLRSKKKGVESELDELASAINCFDNALGLDSEAVEALVGRGQAKVYQGDYDGAIVDFTDARKSVPDADRLISRAYFCRSVEKGAKKDFKGALDDVVKASELCETPAGGMRAEIGIKFEYGFSYKGVGVEKMLDFPVIIDPCAYLWKSFLQMKIGNLSGAVDECTKIIDELPTFYFPYVLRASYNEMRGEFDCAKEDYRHILSQVNDPKTIGFVKRWLGVLEGIVNQ